MIPIGTLVEVKFTSRVQTQFIQDGEALHYYVEDPTNPTHVIKMYPDALTPSDDPSSSKVGELRVGLGGETYLRVADEGRPWMRLMDGARFSHAVVKGYKVATTIPCEVHPEIP